MSYIDMDAVDRQAWDKWASECRDMWPSSKPSRVVRLGEPDDGESLKQVGKDPAREYQARKTNVFSLIDCSDYVVLIPLVCGIWIQDAHRFVLREATMNQDCFL